MTRFYFMGWFVYIVECVDGSYYTGITTDLDRRISEHNSGRGAKYTRSRIPVKLLWCQEFDGCKAAARIEYQIKQMSRQQKKNLVDCDDEMGASF